MQTVDNATTRSHFLLGTILLCALWQVLALAIGLVLLLGIRVFKINTKVMLIIGVVLAITCSVVDVYGLHNDDTIPLFLIRGFSKNLILFKLMTKYDFFLDVYFQFKTGWLYLVGFPILIAALLETVNNAYRSSHSAILNTMSQGKLNQSNNVNSQRINKILSKLNDNDFDGILLGVSENNYKPVVMPDYYVNQIVLVLGTTGAGKTITLRRFFQRAILKGYPLIIVDGKPTNENVDAVRQLTKMAERDFFGFNCGNYSHYNPLSHGGYSELKDKIITLKDEWENDYYRTIAEDYLQTTLEVLIKLGRTIDLKTVSNCLDFENLVAYIREANDKGLAEKVKQLQHYKREALTGLQAHFNVLINSELGQYLASDSQAFNLNAIIENKAVAYFALPALKFPSFAKMVGKLIINDIKTAIEPLESKTPIFIIFDEFSVFAGEQVLNLINMGRGKGVHAILGTQGLADLKKVNSEFESQLLNCVNTVICHRLNHQECAETIAKWIGTQDSYDITAQINLDQNQSRLGSATKNKAFHVHPDEIKQHLKTGEAIYVSKVHDFIVDTVKIKL